MTRTRLNQICAAIRGCKAASARMDSLRAWLEEQRDSAVLPTTKALYQAILDRMEAVP